GARDPALQRAYLSGVQPVRGRRAPRAAARRRCRRDPACDRRLGLPHGPEGRRGADHARIDGRDLHPAGGEPLMGWLGSLRRRRAAKAYVFKLGPWLRRAYGTSRTYTAAQIERGAHDLNLNPRFIVFGHAVFLDRAEFAAIHGILPNPVTIEEARAALR